MALQVWLPLNGTLENKGLSNVTVTNNGATVDNNGKIGKCYAFTGTERIYYNGISFNYPLTISCWVKWSTVDSNTQYAVSHNTNNGGTAGHKIGIGLYSSKISFWHGGAYNMTSITPSTSQWYHLAVSVTNSTYSAYIDGEQVLSGSNASTSINAQYLTIGSRQASTTTGNYFFKGYINDVRIYDHALSAKEVKEISKGLILHYKLDGNDIGLNDIGSQYDTQIYTEPDGSKWKRIFHHNNPASNLFAASDNFPAGVYKSADIWFDIYSTLYLINKFELMIKQKTTSSATEVKYRWIQNINPLTAVWENVLPSLITRITTSGYTNGGYGGLYKYSNSGYNNDTHMVIANNSKSNWFGAIGAWKEFNGGIPGYPSTAITSGYMDLYVRIDNLDEYNKFYDSSGYCNHGSITGTLTTNNDSPRYTKSTVFNGSSFITTNSNTAGKITSAITLSCWAKRSSWTGDWRIAGCTEAGGWTFYPNNNILSFYVYAGGSYVDVLGPQLASISSGWHHFVGTYNGNVAKLYIDGELINSVNKTGTIGYHANNAIFIGAEAGSNVTTPSGSYFNGNISDVRLYATALSEDDIKELYNTSAFVTNNGVFAEYELYEDNLSDVKKKGLLETANFYENGAESGYALDTDKTRVASNYIISEDFIEI